MNINSCNTSGIYGIRDRLKKDKTMKKAGLLTTGILVLAFVTANSNEASAQQHFIDTGNEKLAWFDSNNPVQKGTGGVARKISYLKPELVLHVSGGVDPKYSAEDYAKMLRIMFNDPKRTNFPTEIVVLYEESSEQRKTGVGAFIKGKKFDKNGGEYEGGDGVFTPVEIVGYIPQITEAHAKAYGLASLGTSAETSLTLANN